MRRVILLLTILFTLAIFTISPAFAQVVTPQPNVTQPQPDLEQSQQQSSATLTPQQNALQTITTIKNFVTSADSLLGGFIFYTPNVFGSTITLKDGTSLPGLATYRNMFVTISIPLIALSVAYYALKRLSDDTPYALKSLIKRLIVVAVMFIVTPTLLSYSIQANNLLVNQITSNQTFTTFITDYLNNEQTQIINGANPQNFGIPDSQPNVITGVLGLFWQNLLQIVLFLIALFFFLAGFLFIAFQFIIRFASLLFLSVLYPLAIPFALSEKTEGITNSYFKTWFMFLIHQPAFALGYTIAIGFLEAILKTNGASLGMLFFYSGFLFFLGGVSVLATHIFGNTFSAMYTNLQAALITAPIGRGASEFKRGVISGNGSSISGLAGATIRNRIQRVRNHFNPTAQGSQNTSYSNQGGYTTGSSPLINRQNFGNYRTIQQESPATVATQPQVQQPHQTQSKQQQDPQSLQLQSQGYSITNKKTGVTTTYLTKDDAASDGYKPSQLTRTKLTGNFINQTSLPTNKTSAKNVRDTLKDTKFMQEQNAKGIITKTPARKSKELITRIYTKEDKK